MWGDVLSNFTAFTFPLTIQSVDSFHVNISLLYMLLQWPPPFHLNPVFDCQSGKDREPERNTRSLHLPGIHTAEPSSEEKGQYETTVHNFSRAISALPRAVFQNIDGCTQPLCSGVS